MSRERTGLCVVLALAVLAASSAQAITWTGSVGDWTDGSKWNPVGPPIASDVAYINAGTAQIGAADAAVASYFYVGNGSTDSGAIELSGGTFTATGNHSYVGNSGTGTFTQTGGTATLTNRALYLGMNSTGNGTYTLSGDPLTSKLTAKYLRVGENGAGLFTQTGGTVTVSPDNFIVGRHTGAAGIYNLSGTGVLSAPTEYIGGFDTDTDATGTFNQSGGTHNVTSNLVIGTKGGTGTYNLTAGTLSVGGDITDTDTAGSSSFYIDGTAYTLTVSGGDIKVDNFGVGYNGGTTGEFTIASGRNVSAAFERVGYNGTGTITQTGGTNTVTSGTGAMYIGDRDAGNGTYTLSGGALAATYLRVGERGTGEFNHSGGTVTLSTASSSHDLVVGRYAPAVGTYTLSGNAQLSARSEHIGGRATGDIDPAGTGTFNQSGGTNTITADLWLGNRGGTGTYKLTGGTLSVGGNINDGTGTSNFYIDGPASAYTLTVGGGHITVDNFGVGHASAGSFAHEAGLHTTVHNTLTIGASGAASTLVLRGGTLSVGGDITGGAASNFYIDGTEAAYTLSVGGGDIRVDRLSVGYNGGSTGQFTLAAGGPTILTDYQYIGYAGTGTFTQTGGTNSVTNGTGAIYLGMDASGNGTYNLSGTGQLTARYMRVGENGTGEFNQSGGTVTVTANNLIVGRKTGATGTYNLSGTGQLSAPTEYIGGLEANVGATGTFSQTGGTNTTTEHLRIGYNGGIGTYSISGGTLDVGGTLFVGNSGSTGLLKIVGDDATIEADGYSQNAASTLELDINGISPINVDGSVVLDGFLNVEFTAIPGPGEWFPIILNDSDDAVSGIFVGMPEWTMFRVPGFGMPVQITYKGSFDGGTIGNDVALFTTPEPTTLALLGLGVLGVLRRRTRR